MSLLGGMGRWGEEGGFLLVRGDLDYVVVGVEARVPGLDGVEAVVRAGE